MEFKNRVEKDSIVSLDIYFTIDNTEIVHKGSFKFERKHYFFIEAKFDSYFNEKQTTEITKKILESRSKKLAYAVTRPVSKVKEKAVVTGKIKYQDFGKELWRIFTSTNLTFGVANH